MSHESKRIRKVAHEGNIIEITPKIIRVRIDSRSACASCHAKGLCSASEMQEKIVDVKNTSSEGLNVGDKVLVELEERLGLRAAYIVYAPPIIILVAILLYLQHIKASDLLTGLATIGGISLYFLFLYLFREKIGRKFSFTLRKL